MPSASVAECEKRRDATVEKLNRPSVFSSCNFRTPERCAVVGLRRVKLAVNSPVRAQTNLVGPWVASSRYQVRGQSQSLSRANPDGQCLGVHCRRDGWMSWSEDALVVMMEASHGSPITLRENDAEKGPATFAVCSDERETITVRS